MAPFYQEFYPKPLLENSYFPSGSFHMSSCSKGGARSFFLVFLQKVKVVNRFFIVHFPQMLVWKIRYVSQIS